MPSIDPGQELHFPSKRDWWIVGLIWMGVIVSVAGGVVPVVWEGMALGHALFVISVILGIAALMLWVLYGTGYTVTRDLLLIRCGPFSFRVLLNEIVSITPTRNPLSSPACSLDRLKIVYGDSPKSVMISHVDKSEFFSAIVQHCPSLEILVGQVRTKD